MTTCWHLEKTTRLMLIRSIYYVKLFSTDVRNIGRTDSNALLSSKDCIFGIGYQTTVFRTLVGGLLIPHKQEFEQIKKFVYTQTCFCAVLCYAVPIHPGKKVFLNVLRTILFIAMYKYFFMRFFYAVLIPSQKQV